MTAITKDWRETLPEEWTVVQAGEDGVQEEIPLREHPALAKYATKDEAVKALVHAQRLLGRPPEGYVKLPGKDADQEAMAAFHRSLGCPESPDGYELPQMDLPQEFELRQDMVDGLRARALELGLTPAQVAGLYQWFLPMVLDSHQELQAETERTRKSELDTLRSLHRGQTPSMLDAARSAAEAVGGDELLAVLDKTGAGNHAAVLTAFARLAPLVLEGGLRGAGDKWSRDTTIEQLREMMRDPRYADPSRRDADFVRQVDQGFERLYPGRYVPGSRT